MSRNITQIDTSDTFQVWLQRTNDVISELGTTVVTASTLGDTTVGNSTLLGSLTANTVIAHDILYTNVIDTKAGNTNHIDIRWPIDITATGSQIPLSLKNSLGPRIGIENNSISWQMGLRGSTGTGTDAEFVVGVEGSPNYALRIGPDGSVTTNTLLMANASSSASSAVRSDRTITTDNGITGGGNLTQNLTIGLTGIPLALHQLSGTGIIVKTSANELAVRSIVNGTGISIAFGGGALDNPTIAVDSTVVRNTGDITIGGNKTFSNLINGSISGNADTVTNGVYTQGNQSISGVKTFTSNTIFGVTNDGVNARTQALIRSQGYAGIKIIGDSSNLVDGIGGSYVIFSAGGTVTDAVVGVNNGPTADVAPDGTALSGGVPVNSFVLGTYGASSLRFIVDKQLSATLDTSKNLTVVGNVTAYSDERLKSNVRTIDNALDKVNKMRGVYFEKDGKGGTGVIAQEIERVLPEVVLTGEEYKSVAYGNIVGVLIEAIKQLKSEIEELKGTR